MTSFALLFSLHDVIVSFLLSIYMNRRNHVIHTTTYLPAFLPAHLPAHLPASPSGHLAHSNHVIYHLKENFLIKPKKISVFKICKSLETLETTLPMSGNSLNHIIFLKPFSQKSIHLPTCLLNYLPTDLPVYLPTDLPTDVPTYVCCVFLCFLALCINCNGIIY